MKNLLSSLVLLAMLSLSAFGQDLAPIYGKFPGVGATFPGSTTTNYGLTAIAPITLKRDNGLAVWPQFTSGATAATNLTFTFGLSPDNVTWTTTGPLTYTLNANGTNAVVGYKLFDPSVLDHARYIKLNSLVNGNTNVITVTGVYYSFFNVFR